MEIKTKRLQSRVRIAPNYYVDVRIKCQLIPIDKNPVCPRQHCLLTITGFKSDNEIPRAVLDLVGKQVDSRTTLRCRSEIRRMVEKAMREGQNEIR